MNLSLEHIRLVQNSWDGVEPMIDRMAELFYAHLFELNPHVKTLFKADMQQQGRRIMDMIGSVVRHLNAVDKMLPSLQESGARHENYGVLPEDYDTVAAAFLYALQQCLGDTLTAEVKNAWVDVFSWMTQIMLEVTDQSQ